MKFRKCVILALIAACTFNFASATTFADEPTEEFLKALRKAGYHDAIGYYFDSLKAKNNTTPEFQQSILFEQAVSLIRSSRSIRDAEQKRTTLKKAERLLANFVKANPGHAKKNEAIFEQAAAIRERGKVDLDTGISSADLKRKNRLMASARPLFLNSRRLFLSAKQLFQAELKTYPTSIDRKKESNKYNNREAVRRMLHEAMYFEAVTLFDHARTFAETDPKFTPAMKSAGNSFKNIAQLHRMTANGFRSKFMQGRCYQMMGSFRQALPVYKELTELTGKSKFVTNIRNQAKYYQLTIWNHKEKKEYKLSEDSASKWLSDSKNRDDASTPVGLKIRFQRAIAYEQRSQQEKIPADEKKQLLKRAQDDAQLVSQKSNLHQNDAVMMVARVRKRRGLATSDPKTFTDAYAQAKTIFQVVNEKISDLKIAKDSGKPASEIQKIDVELKKVLKDSIHLLEVAMNLAVSNTDPKQFDDVRFRLSYLYYSGQRYYEAAVLAEGVSLAMKKSTPTKAPDAAVIALSAYISLYNAVNPGQRAFETEQVKKIANFILRNWPNSNRAGEAVAQLAQIHELSGELMEANEWFAKIPKTSAEFGIAQIRIGKNLLSFLFQIDNFTNNQTALNNHLSKINGDILSELLVGLKIIPKNKVTKKKPDELQKAWNFKLKNTSEGDFPELARSIQKLGLIVAEKYFETGMAATSKNLDATAPAPLELLDAKTALAQLKLSQNKYNDAIKLLAQEPHSPFKAIAVPDESKRPDDNSVKGRKYAQSVYQLLIQAYISAGETNKASATLNRLEKLFESSDQSKLTEMLEGIARSLQQDIQRLKKQGDINLLDERVKTLERFLDGLYQKRSTLSYSSLLWIATTYSGIGEGVGDSGAHFYANAAETYAELLKQPNLNDDQILAVKLRLIDCRRLQKDFVVAVEAIGQILKERPNLLIAQLIAPKIFEDWGKSDKDKPEAFLTAINGDKKNGIWGWAKVAGRLQRKMSADNNTPEKYREYHEKFYDTRYRISWCRMEYGKAFSPDPNNSRRRSVLGNAKTEIDSLALISGVLDSKIKSRFEELYRQIQIAQNPSQSTFNGISWPSIDSQSSQPDVQKKKVVADAKTGATSKTVASLKEKEAENSLSTMLVIAIFVGGGGLAFWFVLSMQKQEKKRRKMLASAKAANDTPFDFQALATAGTNTEVRRRKSQKVSSTVKKQRSGTSSQQAPVRKKPKDLGNQ